MAKRSLSGSNSCPRKKITDYVIRDLRDRQSLSSGNFACEIRDQMLSNLAGNT